ncbi:MAG: leucyl-tRNA synthetase [Myxococcaceae bacterium]|nr:leucyl-tRNA synthetase [Myxococcaceae bacterium]
MAEDTLPFRYDAALAAQIETRWQAYWEAHQTFRQPNPGEPDFAADKPKFYCLDMFPYPSGAGLHVGHPEGYTATDILSRYKRMRGFNVLHPMGWDAFGLPAEQYAIQTGVHPALTTRKAIDNFRRQLKRFGFSYDWSREFGTIDPDYYRFTQWIFVQIYEAWFDVEQQKARPIAELVAEFESGARKVQLNPDAAEVSGDDKGRDFGSFAALSKKDKRLVIDSYRLAYLAEQTVNWCPKLGTALANEEVIDGRSERGSYPVFRKPLRQWLFRITAFGQRLLKGLDGLDWPDSTRAKQATWIGHSIGAEIAFGLAAAIEQERNLRVFTTRPDTLFGATYMVVAPEHPLVTAVLTSPQPETDTAALRAYVEAARNRSDLERQQEKKKTGVFTGVYAINPATAEPIPVWVADYVLMGYGTGAIMAVPAHDERDHEFAQAFGLPIREVVRSTSGESAGGCFSGDGVAVNSKSAALSIDQLPTAEAKLAVTTWLVREGLGKKKHNTKLRDWLFSRQRYWGEPFPIVYDEDGDHYPVGVDKLPVVLPEMTDYQPEESDDPRPLLAKAQDWVHTTAAAAGVVGLPADAPVRRETNTMPGWAGSCWYYLRYADPKNQQALIDPEAERYWLRDGVDLYVGGAEHAVLHLLYFRFWHQVLFDLGHVSSPEPVRKLFHQGLILNYAYERADKTLVPIDEVEERGEGEYVELATGARVVQITTKMSKSLRNVVNPDDIISAFGADTFRLYEMYMGPLEANKPWNTRDIAGLLRFLQRAWRLVVNEESGALATVEQVNQDVERQLHRTIAKVGSDLERLAFNTAIASLIGLVNVATNSGLTRSQAERFARVLAPFAPHMGEELWQRLGMTGAVSLAGWPSYDEAMLKDENVEVPVQIMGKVRHRITVPADIGAAELEAIALADDKVKELLVGKTVRKVVVVPGKLVNIVAN